MLRCPRCGAREAHPTRTDMVLIRGYKVESRGCWWSQCLVCSGYYDKDLMPDSGRAHDPRKGWFPDGRPGPAGT